jgi:hypothetical protein
VVDLRSAPLSLSGPILQDRIVLVDRDPPRRHGWEAGTTLRWLDFRPALEEFSALRRQKLRARLQVERR